MATLSPYLGWLVTPEAAPRVVTPAYDVMSDDERGQLAAAEPDSFLNVVRTRPAPAMVGAGEGDPTGLDTLLAAERHTVDRLVEEGAFAPMEVSGFHVLRLAVGDHVQVGIVGTVPVADIGDTVRLHESTRTDKERQLVRHLEVVGIQSSPIELVHPGPSPVADLLSEVTARVPDLVLTQPDGLHQQVWTVHRSDEVATIVDAFAAFPALYLTDGHHRAAAAVRYAERRRAEVEAAGHEPDPDAPWEEVLVAVFPATEVRLHSYHRVVQPLGAPPAEVRDRLATAGALEPVEAGDLGELAAGTAGVFLAGGWHRLVLEVTPGSGPTARLATTLLQERVLGPVLGVHDPRTDPRLTYVPGTLGLDALAERAGPDGVAIALPATTLAELVAVADAGGTMPPKSTWFEPKLRSGVFLRRVHR